MDIHILARGVDWIAVDKPAGLVVHRTSWAADRDVMLTRVRDALGQHVFPVHRLDRPTSGVLLFGLDSEGAHRMKNALEVGTKTYVTLVRGQADALNGVRIDRPLKPEGGGEPKPSSTFFEVLGSSPEPRCSLVLAKPSTGRYHQIRRHLAGRSHPVLGDSSHGDTKLNRRWIANGLPRLLLHCGRIQLPHEDGRLDIRAPVPADMASFLATLPFYATAAALVPELLPAVSSES